MVSKINHFDYTDSLVTNEISRVLERGVKISLVIGVEGYDYIREDISARKLYENFIKTGLNLSFNPKPREYEIAINDKADCLLHSLVDNIRFIWYKNIFGFKDTVDYIRLFEADSIPIENFDRTSEEMTEFFWKKK